MKEDFLHYVWKFQKFKNLQLFTTEGAALVIEKVGQHNKNAGPDFFNSIVIVDGQKWAGNVEIHINTSHWYAHNHEVDPAYDNVVLHVVYEHNTEIYRKDGTAIPTLELKGLIEKDTLGAYEHLFKQESKWINCEPLFPEVDPFLIKNWVDRLYFERLEHKSALIFKELEATNNDWEAVLFRLLAKNFGLKVNGASFLSVAQSVDFSVIKKCVSHENQLEALLFGQAGLLEKKAKGPHYRLLKKEYKYLQKKFDISNSEVIPAQFFRLRPPNFPTIRLSQLASLFEKQSGLFSQIIGAKELEEFYEIFKVEASNYWSRHFNFEIISNLRRKGLTKKFIDLLLINTIIPIKFSYSSFIGKDITEEIVQLASAIVRENNNIITKFNTLQPIAKTAMDSQGLSQLKNNYCDLLRCMECEIANAILKR